MRLVKMTSSQTYGPIQVRDLSEYSGRVSHQAAAFLCRHTTEETPSMRCESPSPESHNVGGRQVTAPFSFTVWSSDSQVHSNTWTGAPTEGVRGSTPSVTMCEHGFRLAYITSEARRLNTVAAKKYCGGILANNGT